MAGDSWTREEVTRACYSAVLHRAPENDAVVADHARRHAAPETLIHAFAGSAEAEEWRRRRAAAKRIEAAQRLAPFEPGALRVMLFGAFGNGNIGDSAQAEAVAALLRRAAPRPLDIRACSWIDHEPYPFDPGRVLPPEAIADPWMLREFGLLMIGGGGLFGAPHHPLSDPDWIGMLHRMGLPYGLFGVGVASSLPQAPELVGPWQSLLERACFRSARDADSLSAMPGGEWLADPVLLAGLEAGGGKPRPARPGARPLIILRWAVEPLEEQFMDWVAATGQGCDLVAVEPRCEQALLARFPQLWFAKDMAALQAACATASVVVSTRYHGSIAAMLAGVPFLGFGAWKNRALFEALGVPDQYFDRCDLLAERLATPPPPLDLRALAPLRLAANATLLRLAGVLAALP